MLLAIIVDIQTASPAAVLHTPGLVGCFMSAAVIAPDLTNQGLTRRAADGAICCRHGAWWRWGIPVSAVLLEDESILVCFLFE